MIRPLPRKPRQLHGVFLARRLHLMCIYIYIYVDRERERYIHMCVCIHIYIYIYIYILLEREREREIHIHIHVPTSRRIPGAPAASLRACPIRMLPVSVNNTLLLWQPWPWNPAAETAFQPLIWCVSS